MPRDYSNTRCHHCHAYGHLKRTCPSIKRLHVGVISVHAKGQKNTTPHHGKIQEPLAEKVVPTICIPSVFQVGYLTCEPIEKRPSNTGEDSNSDSDSLNLNYCSICDTNTHDDMECLQEEMMAFHYTCHYCDKTGHFEHNCPTFLKAAEEQEDYDKKWRQKWGKKIENNRKRLQSMSKSSESSGMQCQYCYSIHHKTEFCFLKSYGIREQLNI